MQKPRMYAMCTNDNGAGLSLEKGKEYRIVHVKTYSKFAGYFFTLEDGFRYPADHFSVTYLK